MLPRLRGPPAFNAFAPQSTRAPREMRSVEFANRERFSAPRAHRARGSAHRGFFDVQTGTCEESAVHSLSCLTPCFFFFDARAFGFETPDGTRLAALDAADQEASNGVTKASGDAQALFALQDRALERPGSAARARCSGAYAPRAIGQATQRLTALIVIRALGVSHHHARSRLQANDRAMT